MLLLKELIEDLLSLTSVEPNQVEVLIATRQIAGIPIEDAKEVQLREIGSIEVDEGDSELKFVPRMIAGNDSMFESPITIATLKTYADVNPGLSEYEIYTVDRRGLLDDGGKVSLNLPVLGLAGKTPTEIWILQPPQDQWPTVWFSDPA